MAYVAIFLVLICSGRQIRALPRLNMPAGSLSKGQSATGVESRPASQYLYTDTRGRTSGIEPLQVVLSPKELGSERSRRSRFHEWALRDVQVNGSN
jgi:hypothetical protein